LQEMRQKKWRKRNEVENEGEGGEGSRPRRRRKSRKISGGWEEKEGRMGYRWEEAKPFLDWFEHFYL